MGNAGSTKGEGRKARQARTIPVASFGPANNQINFTPVSTISCPALARKTSTLCLGAFAHAIATEESAFAHGKITNVGASYFITTCAPACNLQPARADEEQEQPVHSPGHVLLGASGHSFSLRRMKPIRSTALINSSKFPLKGLTPKKQSESQGVDWKRKADHFPAKTRSPFGTGSAANR